MRVCVPFVRLHPLAAAALERHFPEAEYYQLSQAADAYWRLLCQLWREGESFLIVEQDIEVHAGVHELESCERPWCLFPFPGAGAGQPGDALLYGSLGCTRFTASLMEAYPQLMEQRVHNWRILDSEVYGALRALSHDGALLEPHLHWPAVGHHHVYRHVQGAPLCSCGEVHDEYPVDAEGRYCGP